MSKISRTVVFEHVQRFVREVYADRLRQAGFSSYRNEDIHWYKLVNNDVIHAVYFVTDYMSFPVNLEIRYGCHPLFIPPVFQRSPFVDTSYGYEQMYERIPELVPGSMPYGVQRSVVRGPVNRIYRAPDILVSCPADEHIGQSVLEKVLAILDAADSPMACYMAHKSWRLSQIENDSWLTMTSYFADGVLYWKDQALYPYCMRYVNGKLELLEKAKEERKHYRKTDQEEHQRLLDLRSAFSDEMPTEYMQKLRERASENLRLLEKFTRQA